MKQLLDSGQITADETIEIDGRAAFKTAAACRGPGRSRPRLLFQHVPRPKTVKNRVHLDLHVGDERRDAEVERCTALIGSRLWDGQQGPQRWDWERWPTPRRERVRPGAGEPSSAGVPHLAMN